MQLQSGVIFYAGKKRIGRLSMSKLCFFRMQEYQLTYELLEEAFRYGREIDENKLVYPDGDRFIGVIYAEDHTRGGVFRGNLNDIWFTLITCWAQKPR